MKKILSNIPVFLFKMFLGAIATSMIAGFIYMFATYPKEILGIIGCIILIFIVYGLGTVLYTIFKN